MNGPTSVSSSSAPARTAPLSADDQAFGIIARTSRYGHYDLDAMRGQIADLRRANPANAAAVEQALLRQLTPVQQGDYARGTDTKVQAVEPLGAKDRAAVCHGPPAGDGPRYSRDALTHVAQANGKAAADKTWDPLNLLWFRDQVRNKGPWDYKQQDRSLQDFGNYNYGYTGSAMKVSADFLQRQAGKAQQAAGTSRPDWGSPGLLGMIGGTAPYGDDPRDQTMMIQGMEDRRNGC